MRNTLETRLGIFFALALIAAVVILEMIGSFNPLKQGIKVRAYFDRVQELKAGDPVKMAGVQIGRVGKIELVTNKVSVVMRLDEPKMVKTDSKATIKFVGLLGQNYVSIDFGTEKAPPVTSNSILETTEQADLSTLMVKLENVATGVENLTKSFNGENLNNILGPFTDFLRENSPRLTAILGNIQTISTQIAQGKGTVGKVIMDDQLYSTALGTVTNLNATATDVRGVIAQAKDVVSKIQAGQGTIGKLTTDEALYREAAAAVTSMREILDKINKGQGSVGKLVNDESMFRNVKLTLQKVEKATEGLEDQGPLSVVGIMVNSLF